MSNVNLQLDHFAEDEFYDIVNYYKQFERSLSADFIQTFDQAIQRVKNFPEAGTTYLHNTRRIILNRFPFAVVYKIYSEKEIVVHAIVHLKRKPGYWEERLQ